MRAASVRAGIAGALLTAVVAACSGSSAGSTPLATSRVDLPPSYKFVPADITVAAGTTVAWTNNDHFTHSIQFLDGGLPTQPMLMDPGASVTFTFHGLGTFHYQCSLHPQNMKGTVVVTP